MQMKDPWPSDISRRSCFCLVFVNSVFTGTRAGHVTCNARGLRASHSDQPPEADGSRGWGASLRASWLAAVRVLLGSTGATYGLMEYPPSVTSNRSPSAANGSVSTLQQGSEMLDP
ncbi:unnamed protein product [Lota lota]